MARVASVPFREAFFVFSGVAVVADLYLIFLWVPTEVNQGIVQRIMYVHVPVALLSFLAFGLLFVSSVGYLVRRGRRWDALAYAAAEVGVVLLTLTLVTGTIWARPTWGAWWTWEPLLTTVLVLWLMAVAYLMLRAYAPAGEREARFGAVLGTIIGLATPFVYFSVELWGSLVHPEKVVGPATSSESSLGPSIELTLLFSMLALALFFGSLLVQRYALRRAEDDVEELVAAGAGEG